MRRISDRIIAVISVIVFAASLVLPIWVGMHNYATGDDLLYGAVVRNLLKEHASLGVIWAGAWEDVIREWYLFQGTWSSEILWRFEPSIWSENAYHITIFISLGMLSSGIWYFLHVLLRRVIGISRSVYICIACWASFYSIQYMPYPRGGLYWFTGMTHYTLAYALALYAISWTIMYLRDGRLRYLLGAILISAYMGGSGYPGVVVAGLGLFLVMLYGVLFKDRNGRQRSLLMLIPIVLIGIGFIISAIAPGNAIRGGEDYGFSVGRVLEVFGRCFISGLTDPYNYLISVRPLFLLPIGTFVLVGGATERVNVESEGSATRHIPLKQMIFLNVSVFLVMCMVHAPEVYAGETVEAGISGGVYDSYYYVTVLFLTILSVSMGIYLAPVFGRFKYSLHLYNLFFAGAVLFCVLFHKHLIGNMLDYNCYKYVFSGQMNDYEQQMQERFRILKESGNVVYLPFIGDEQGPLMHFAITSDPDAYSNSVATMFYDKDRVFGVERSELYYHRPGE